MVDFDNETTIGVPAADITKILILQRRTYLFDSYEAYLKQQAKGVQADQSVMKARLHSLFLELQATLKRRLTKEDEYKQLILKINSDNIDDLYEAMLFLNEQLDDMNLTRLDTRRRYDSTKVENENKEKGL